MTDTTYNGWTNYETWLWKLWIDNDQGWQEMVISQAEATLGTLYAGLDIGDTIADEYLPTSEAVYQLSHWLREQCEEMADEQIGQTGPFADLIGASVSRINWYEIAESFIDDLELAT